MKFPLPARVLTPRLADSEARLTVAVSADKLEAVGVPRTEGAPSTAPRDSFLPRRLVEEPHPVLDLAVTHTGST